MPTLEEIGFALYVVFVIGFVALIIGSLYWVISTRRRWSRALRHASANEPEPVAEEPPAMRVIEELDPDSPFDQDADYVRMRHEAILLAFNSGRAVIGDANGIRFADEPRDGADDAQPDSR